MRAIIRFSLDKDRGSALRNKLVPILEARGFRRRLRTASWEAANVTERNLRYLLRDFWRTCEEHTGEGKIDHFWMYSDKVPVRLMAPDDEN